MNTCNKKPPVVSSPARYYTSETPVSDLILECYDILLVMMRFGIPLGFGDNATIGEVSSKNKVHTPTLLATINVVAYDADYNDIMQHGSEELSAVALMEYLKQSHHYFLSYRLPLLRKELTAAIKDGPKEITVLIMRFFDEYVEEVKKHMGYENKTVFPYVERMLEGTLNTHDEHYNIGVYGRRHDKVEAKISELKNILIKYYPDGKGYDFTFVVHELFETEHDLATHNAVEDNLFIPLISLLEAQKGA